MAFSQAKAIRRLAAAMFLSAIPVACGDAPPPPAAVGGPYALVDQDGASRTPEDFRGAHVIYYFGFTHCPDVCPAALSLLSAALDRVEGGPIRPVFVSVDPERDSPEAIKRYLSWDDRFTGLTGAPEDLAPVYDAYRVYAEKVPLPESALGYTVDHSSVFLLFDESHRFVRPFSHNLSPEELAEAIDRAL